VKDAIQVLKRKGFITHSKFKKDGKYVGFSYQMDDSLMSRFLEDKDKNCTYAFPFIQPVNQLATQPDRQSVDQLATQPDRQSVDLGNESAATHYSSSSFFKVPTTTKSENHKSTKSPVDAIAEVLASHPELGYWRQKNLTPQQVQKWMEITGASLESIIQSLCHCRFEMVELDMEKQKDIQNVFNWFYRIIERAGFYPRPKEYKSYLERQLEIEKKLLAEKQERLKALAELQQQKKETERSLAFYEMLAQPDSELYQQCFSRLDKFTQNTKNASLFERFMRDAFDQIMDEREQQLLAEAKARGSGDGSAPPQIGPQKRQNAPGGAIGAKQR